MDYLLENAELNIVEFDINNRNTMNTFQRRLPYYVMSYHKKGEAKLRVADKVYTITPGTVVIIPPNTVHDHFKDTEEETVFLWCHFTFTIGGVIDVLKIFNLPMISLLENSREFEKAFVEFKESTNKPGLLSHTILRKAKAHELLYLLLEGTVNSHNQEFFNAYQNGEFIQVLTQIVEHPEKEISLTDLSEQFHLHPTYICNRFKELFGKSPLQVHRELKIQRAKALLQTSGTSVTEIALSLGFSGTPSFTRLFKSYVGISPTQYRNLNRKWEVEI